MNVLVTGGAGYIGSMTCKELVKKGHRVFVYDNLSNSQASFAKWGDLIVGDINDQKLLVDVLTRHKIEAVFHFAALIEVGESVKHPLRFMHNNVTGTYNLLEAMGKVGVKYFIFSSSCATYENTTKIPISEDTVQIPVSVYGDTKLIGEKMMRAVAAVGDLKTVALRYFNASGADPEGESGESHDPETHLIPLVIKSVYDEGFTLKVFGQDYPTPDGTCIRDYTHVTDLAVAHVKALEWSMTAQTSFEAFNLGSGQGSSVLEVIRQVEVCTGQKVKYSLEGRRPGDSSVLVADISKATRLLGWTPSLSKLDYVVSTACQWHKKFHYSK